MPGACACSGRYCAFSTTRAPQYVLCLQHHPFSATCPCRSQCIAPSLQGHRTPGTRPRRRPLHVMPSSPPDGCAERKGPLPPHPAPPVSARRFPPTTDNCNSLLPFASPRAARTRLRAVPTFLRTAPCHRDSNPPPSWCRPNIALSPTALTCSWLLFRLWRWEDRSSFTSETVIRMSNKNHQISFSDSTKHDDWFSLFPGPRGLENKRLAFLL